MSLSKIVHLIISLKVFTIMLLVKMLLCKIYMYFVCLFAVVVNVCKDFRMKHSYMDQYLLNQLKVAFLLFLSSFLAV